MENGTDLIPEAYSILSQNYPKDKFAQYSTNYDAIQVFFWNIMQNEDAPIEWLNFSSDFAPWSVAMNTISGGLSVGLSNYRRYIEPGCNHTIFRFPEYYSSTVGDITFLAWMTAMTGEKNANKDDWLNLSCTPGFDCGESSLTVDGINACLSRTFGS